MKICKVCKCENEEQFVYCKNCGAMLEVIPPVKNEPEIPAAPIPAVQNTAPKNLYENVGTAQPAESYNASVSTPPSLVPVKMVLPEPTNPEIKTVQTVYVTPAQKAAIQYDILKQNNK